MAGHNQVDVHYENEFAAITAGDHTITIARRDADTLELSLSG